MSSSKRTSVVTVRFDEEEREGLRSACESLGLSTSDTIRFALAATGVALETGFDVPIVVMDMQDVRDLYRELVRQGTNLNQVAHAMNLSLKMYEGASPLDQVMARTRVWQAQEELKELRENLNRAWAAYDVLARRPRVLVDRKPVAKEEGGGQDCR